MTLVGCLHIFCIKNAIKILSILLASFTLILHNCIEIKLKTKKKDQYAKHI